MAEWVVRNAVDGATAGEALDQDRHWNGYAIADLEPPFGEYARVAVAARRGAPPSAALLVLRHPEFTAMVPHGDPGGLAAILDRIDLPTRTFLFVRPDHRAALGRHYRLSEKPMVRMALDVASFRPPGDEPAGLRRLAPTDAAALHQLYALYPESAFVDDHLVSGVFYGAFAAGRLVAAAGTHVVARRGRIAAVGNVFTHPTVRGRGYAAATTAHVVADLLATGFRDVILNVAAANDTARRIYERLGFVEHCRYTEGMAQKL